MNGAVAGLAKRALARSFGWERCEKIGVVILFPDPLTSEVR